jgi:thiamine-phosphate pyrophosphorylase
VSIPELTLITPELPAEEILRRSRAALSGASVETANVALQLRARHLDPRVVRELAEALRELTRTRGVALVINADLELALAVAADGVQLPERGPSVEQARARLGVARLIGVSRHDADGVASAARAGASFALLGPVHDVPGKGPALGVEAFGRIAAASSIAVIALGGLHQERIPPLYAAGAAGIAVIREVFDAPDPGQATELLLSALAAARASGAEALPAPGTGRTID